MTLAREIRDHLDNPLALVAALALDDRPRRQAGGCMIRCVAPGHDDRRPSLSIRVARDGTIACKCHGCGWTGDALSLIALADGLDTRRDWPDVLRHGAVLAGRHDLADMLDRSGHRPVPMSTFTRRAVPPAPERDYPPAGEVAELFKLGGYVADDPEGRAMLESRGLDVEMIDDRALARVLPVGATLPHWARFGGRPWTESGHRLVLPVVDETGNVRSVRAWHLAGAHPKRLPPGGYRASGLVLACPFARGMLAGDLGGPLRVVVTEGEPDFLTWATRFSDADETAPAVLGIAGSGSWSAAVGARVPVGAHVTIRTHHDGAGEAYAAAVFRSLGRRCSVLRSRVGPPEAA